MSNIARQFEGKSQPEEEVMYGDVRLVKMPKREE